MKLLTAGIYECSKHVRNYKMTAILLALPVLTIYLLGKAVGQHFTGDLGDDASMPAMVSTFIEQADFGGFAALPTMIDYYAVITLLQVLIIGAIYGVFIVSTPAGSDLFIRMQSLPVSRWTILLGKAAGSVVYLFATALAVILITRVAFQANWSGNFAVIGGTLLVFCIIAVGIGMVIGQLIRSTSTSLMIVLLLMVIFGAVSGAVSPESANDSIGIITPNYHAKILLFGSIYGYSRQVMLESAIWLAGITVIIYGLVAVMGRRTQDDHL